MNPNNVSINYLRMFIIVLVVAVHSIMAYACFFPPSAKEFTSEPYLWYLVPVVDSLRWVGFDVFGLFNTTFLMSLMFFLSGLFVWPSIVRKGPGIYLRNRFLRLGLPFVVVTVFLMPLAYYPAYLLTGGDPGVSAYFRQWFSLGFWPSGPCWFIALLLLFDCVAVFVYQFAFSKMKAFGSLCNGVCQRPIKFFLGLVAVSIISYLTMLFSFGPLHLFIVGPFSIQTSRVLLYLTYFFAGLGIGIAGIDSGFLFRDSQFARRWPWWLGGGVIMFGLLVFLSIQAKMLGNTSSPEVMSPVSSSFGMGIYGITLVLSCGTISFFLLAIFIRFANRRFTILESLSRDSYGIFLVHYVFVIWAQYVFLDFALSAFQKGASVFILTFFLSWITTVSIRWLIQSRIRK